MFVILATREAEIRRMAVQGQPRQIVRESLFLKYPTHKKRAGEMAQVVKFLPRKHEALSSNSSTAKKKKKKERKTTIMEKKEVNAGILRVSQTCFFFETIYFVIKLNKGEDYL
jgi:hypothetical protein